MSENKKYDPFRQVEYLSSYTDVKSCPTDKPIVVFCGRSNAGKSSLLSAVCDHKNLARASTTAGKTQLINYFTCPEGFYLVDLPGFGYATLAKTKIAEIQQFVNDFLFEHGKNIVLVADCRRDMGDTEYSILKFAKDNKRKVFLARTKWDTLTKNEQFKKKKDWERENLHHISFPLSNTKKTGIQELVDAIRGTVG